LRIAVIGAGAMGSLYAAHFALSGRHDVWAIDRWRKHVEAIRQQGLLVTGVNGEVRAFPKSTCDAAAVQHADMVVIATKSADAEAAATDAAALAGTSGIILTIQNGIGAADRVAVAVGAARLLIGVAGGFAAKMVAPGHVHHFGWNAVKLGEYLRGDTARLRFAAELWRDAGFDVEAYADLHPVIWEKLLCNAAFNGPCALTGMTVGEMLANEEAMKVSAACAVEAHAVARAKGINLDIDDPVAFVIRHSAKIPDARPSTAQDHLARRRSEIDEINGAVARLAEEVGIAAPTNAAVAALIKARESTF
jgi:2-dehydropantoate 2-reductase